MDTIIFVCFAFLSFLPLSTTFHLIRIAVVLIAALIKVANQKGISEDIGKLVLNMLLCPVIPVIMVILIDSKPISTSLVLHEVMRLLFASAAIFVASKLKISFKVIYIVTAVILVSNLIIQFCQYLQISQVYDFIRSNYVFADADEWSHLDLSTEEGGGFRAGSIFLNPNVYMVIPLMSQVVFYQKKIKGDTLLNKILIGCSLVSCYFTGSRTSIIVSLAIIFLYYFKYDKKRLPLAIIIGIIVLVFLMKSGFINSRAFGFKDKSDMGSLFSKFKGFVWYWRSSNPVYWITGSLGSKTAVGIDCEWGHIYTWFGIHGLYWYVNYYRLIKRANAHIDFYPNLIVIIMGLTAITSSLLLSMQVFSFVCVLAFSYINIESNGDNEIHSIV